MSADVIELPLCIGPDHPSLAGHFPGRPVVPGVVLLDQVAAALEQAGCAPLRRLDAVKFLAPLAPGEHARLRLDGSAGRVRFRIDCGARAIVRGEATLADPEPAP